MYQSDDYLAPTPADYLNVLALNTAFIKATTDLKGPQRGRLSVAPFLLFSLRENELEWWDLALANQRQGDLIASAQLQSSELRRIQTAALSFLWQLGGRNPYAARIICGAKTPWCDKLTDLPLVTLLERIGARDDLMISRLHGTEPIVGRLLGDGTSSRRSIRRSSQLAALQSLLTRKGADEQSLLPAAACRLSVPLRVSDKKL
jgi:hypothetical protein